MDGQRYTGSFFEVPKYEKTLRGWFDLPYTGFDQAKWGYPHDGFFCNGIRIPWGMAEYYSCGEIAIAAPSVSVIDRIGTLQVDIARRFLNSFPQEAKQHLVRESVRYAMAELLMADWGSGAAIASRLENGIPIIKRADKITTAPLICGEGNALSDI